MGIAMAVFGWGLLLAAAPTTGSTDFLQSINPRGVQMGGEMGRRMTVTMENNLLKLDLDGDFLKPFRDHNAKDGYIGLGKTIDAFVRFAAWSNDPRVLEKKQYLVRETIAAQGPDGYIGLCAPESRMWKLWDVHEMAYIIYGLTMDHKFFGEQAPLDAARKLADYIIAQWTAAPDRTPGDNEIQDYMAFTNIELALLDLYDACAEQKYLDFAARFRGLDTWDGPIVLGRFGKIQGHAYTYMNRCIAQMRLNRIEPNPALLIPAHKVMDFLMHGDGLVVTGACGQHECWHNTQEGAGNLGETCATAYLLRFLDEQLRMNADPLYGDLMERAIHNALFAAQSPEGRKLRYYAPFEGPRVYFDKDTYCCPCNYRRIIAQLPEMVYYTNRNGVTVNLYTESTATLTLHGGNTMEIKQATDYPSAGKVAISVIPDKPAEFSLSLRVPRWCADAGITVNGKPVDGPVTAGTFKDIRRLWQPGDTVIVTLPMKLQLVKGRQAQAGRAVVMYGPKVFCLDRARNPKLKDENLRMLTLDPATLSGPTPDDTVHPNGLACTVSAWCTTNWYPMAPHDFELTLTEFPDPDGEAAYFHVPNPEDPLLTDDPLFAN